MRSIKLQNLIIGILTIILLSIKYNCILQNELYIATEYWKTNRLNVKIIERLLFLQMGVLSIALNRATQFLNVNLLCVYINDHIERWQKQK